MGSEQRWEQRFSNFSRTLRKLGEAVEACSCGEMNEIEQEGLIQRFEYTYELSWNTIKDFYENQGETGIQGSRDAFRIAFSRGLISRGEEWMKMIESRKLTVHTYHEATAREIAASIANEYYALFVTLHERLKASQQA